MTDLNIIFVILKCLDIHFKKLWYNLTPRSQVMNSTEDNLLKKEETVGEYF